MLQFFFAATTGALASDTQNRPEQKPTGPCILPEYPEHGNYSVTGAPNAVPGQGFNTLELNVTCKPGYGTFGESIVYCVNGKWSVQELPQCIRFCKLDSHPSVIYNCLLTGTNEGFRPCRNYEPHGTKVYPICNAPNYYTPTNFNYMTCIDGNWDYIATCLPECGKVMRERQHIFSDGSSVNQESKLPWHVGIYRKTRNPYMQMCGGSLVSTTVVISAAHCFWDGFNKLLPAENYAVAVGKIYRPWNSPQDKFAQKSDVTEKKILPGFQGGETNYHDDIPIVKEIKIPPSFQGGEMNYQDDIAIVKLVTPFEFNTYVIPICLDFNLEHDQLQEGNLGKVAGWGLTAEDGKASTVLKVVNLPYIDIDTCIRQSPATFREYITKDKICTGYGNGTSICSGDGGGGLVFPGKNTDRTDGYTERYYLRGVVSIKPRTEDLCNAFTVTMFTNISSHQQFIEQNMRASE